MLSLKCDAFSHRFFLCAIPVYAADAPFGSASISGLGARNIGSAAMSGRISCIAGVHEPSGKITLFVGSASGGVWKSDDSGTRYRPIFDEQPCNRSAPSRSIRRIRKTFGSAPVKRGRAIACPLATESTNPPMAAKHGRALDWRNPNASDELRLIQETATRSSPQFPARYGAIRRSRSVQNNRWRQNVAASFKRRESFDRVHRHSYRPEQSRHHVCRDVGFPAQRLGIPIGRRNSDGAFSQWIVPFDRWWQHLDGDYRAGQQRFPKETVWTPGGGDRAIEIATRLRICRVAGERVVRFR